MHTNHPFGTIVRRSAAPKFVPDINEPETEAQSPDQLRERIRLLEAVIGNFPGGLLLFDQDLRLVLCNKQQLDLLEYPQALFSSGNPTLKDIIRCNAERGEYGPGSVEMHVSTKMALVEQKLPHVFERTRPNGTILEIRGVPLAEGGFVTTYLDVTEQRKNQTIIEHMALHDSITGLPNRTKLAKHLNQALDQIAEGQSFAVHYIDLDRFKPINDSHGHQVGDNVLESVAKRLLDSVRETDFVARIGGDEFIIIQLGIRSARDAEHIAKRVIGSISREHFVENKSYSIGASIGISVAPDDSMSSDELVRKADIAMYRSKKSGGNQFNFFSQCAA